MNSARQGAHLVRDEGAGGSNPLTPTNKINSLQNHFFIAAHGSPTEPSHSDIVGLNELPTYRPQLIKPVQKFILCSKWLPAQRGQLCRLHTR
jgi:hypothetical protein